MFRKNSFFLWKFYSNLGHGLLLRDFAITLFEHTTLGSTPLEEWSARRRDFYLTTHNAPKRETAMPTSGYESIIPEASGLRPRNHWDQRDDQIVEVIYKSNE
jgi:hypothetical protein